MGSVARRSKWRRERRRGDEAAQGAAQTTNAGGVMSQYTITDEFDADFGVEEWHGTNAFYRDDDGRIFRTYFINARGDEALGSAWAYLDMTALGRQEDWEDSPEGYPQTKPYGWWNLHDEYDNATVFEAALSAVAASQRGSRSRP
jgi:predicted dithiol-disulfide oxidoreductase (DUF899 family)